MIQDEFEEEVNPKFELLKKIFTWAIVIFISLMLLFIIIFQPRFFTFVQ